MSDPRDVSHPDTTGEACTTPRQEGGGLRRREMLASTIGGIVGGTLAALASPSAVAGADVPGARRPRRASAAATDKAHVDQRPSRPGQPGRDYRPVVVPNGTKLPWKIVDGVKVFHLVAEEIEHTFAPGLVARCWAYNRSVHGPLIEAVEGDRVRIYVTNRLPAPTTVHWHGILLPNGMDGVGGLNQRAIRPGETFKYEFTLRQSGCAMYHSHHDEMTQIALGMGGLFVIHPRRPGGPQIDRDFAILLHEWRIDAGARRPNPNEMSDFNVLTMNAKVFPATDPLVARVGERVRIRLANLSVMSHHPIHLHGYQFRITETDGGRIEESAQWPETTVVVPVGSTRTIEFVADEPGDWALHCHMTHHVMNQMGHDIPNMIGVNDARFGARASRAISGYMTMGQTGMDMSEHQGQMPVPANSIPMVGAQGKHDYITMGGMFTVLKVRQALSGYADPGWYENPENTLASLAPAGDLERDGIDSLNPPAADGAERVRFGG
jgi:hypothetical protein